jgi:hypothetical protein
VPFSAHWTRTAMTTTPTFAIRHETATWHRFCGDVTQARHGEVYL